MKPEIDNTQIGSIYESDEEIPQYPPRTKLYSLQPCGLGTAMVESLSGYVARLAFEHSTRVGDLVGRVLSPIENPYGNIVAPNRKLSSPTTSHHGFVSYSYLINGATDLAERLVLSLEAATGLDCLRGLTFLRYKPAIIAFPFHKQRTWCPQCFSDWRTNHAPFYEPLIWTCSTTTTCPTHGGPLTSVCPECRQAIGAPLKVGTCIGYCDHCGAWLGQAGQPPSPSDVAIDDDAIWRQEQVIRLIKHLPDVQPHASSDGWKRNLGGLIKAVTNGNAQPFAECAGVNRQTLSRWIDGSTTPLFELAMRMSRASNISLWCFVSESPLSDSHLAAARESLAESKGPFQRMRPQNNYIRAELAKSLRGDNPETLASITSRLGLTNPRRLHSVDKQATRAIAERRRKSFGNRPDQPFDDSRVRSILLQEITSGHPRSLSAVATELGFNPNTLKYHLPELCKDLVNRRKDLREQARAVAISELTRALEETPMPTMTELGARLGHCPQMLQHWAPAICRNIAKRSLDSYKVERIRIHDGLKRMLSETPPPYRQDAYRRLGTNYIFVMKYFPELLAELQEKRRLYQVELKQARMEGLVLAVRDAINEIIAKGIHISRAEVTVRIPAHLQRMGWFAIDRAIAKVRENP